MDETGRGEGKDERSIESCIRNLAEGLGEGMLVLRDGRIVFADECFDGMAGLAAGESVGRPLSDFFFENAESRSLLDYLAGAAGDEAFPSPDEIRLKRRDGAPLFLRCRRAEAEWEGTPSTILFLENVTHRKSAEKQLLEQKEMNAILTDTVRRILAFPVSLGEITRTILDSAMEITKSDSGALLFADGSRERVLERRCENRCDGCLIPEAIDGIMEDEALMDKRRPGRIEGAFYLNGPFEPTLKCSGGFEILSILRVPAWSPSGNGEDLYGQIVLVNSTEGYGPWDLDNMEKVVEVLNLALLQSRFIDELEEARELAEKEAEAQSRFLANVGHEVRSPLNGVMMMASMLRDSDLDEEQREQLDIVLFSARTIDRLIRDISDLTLIRTGKIAIQEEPFDLRELCRHLVETNRPEALRKGLGIFVEIAEEARRIVGDRERTGQIVNNLITNAIKYTDQGEIRLTAAIEGDMVRLDVADTGRGIAANLQRSVFEMFRRGGDHKRAGGTGIGLFVVKNIVEMMGGRVTLESTAGEGSRFTVLLPRNQDVESSADRALNHEARDPKGVPKILVAEDEGVNRLFLKNFLEQEGFRVDEAVDGVEAVAQAKRYDYDLILMDINMPRMDGLEAISSIKRLNPEIPIIAVTAYAYQDEYRRIRDNGADDVVMKPIEENLIRRKLEKYLRR